MLGRRKFKIRNKISWSIMLFMLRNVAHEEWAEIQLARLHPVKEKKLDVWREKYPTGSTLFSRCAGCDTAIYQEMTEQATVPRVYCRKKCSEIHRVRMQKYVDSPEPCPVPHKVSYPNGEVAHKQLNALVKANPDLVLNRPYACVCGRYHLGNWFYEIVGMVEK